MESNLGTGIDVSRIGASGIATVPMPGDTGATPLKGAGAFGSDIDGRYAVLFGTVGNFGSISVIAGGAAGAEGNVGSGMFIKLGYAGGAEITGIVPTAGTLGIGVMTRPAIASAMRANDSLVAAIWVDATPSAKPIVLFTSAGMPVPINPQLPAMLDSPC
jgi:hypothetical protein